ncbi:uncharacterized protein LOC132554778 [Ylistrum balloti]|uniref:uncharacterized protein LOC132554778 n=1 Tax=Ylistrum balloti TaxID=509963 RepID=UPI002905E09B|nr:uncharacterized protein LOC132554778 [Ylistrum balloti]
MVVNTWLVLLFLSIHATFVGGRYYKAQRLERQVPPHGGTNPHCQNKIDNCEEHIGQYLTMCSPDSPFYEWATTNCKAYCGVCQGGPTTIEHICLDELNYSDIFDIPQACLDFAKRASQNCHRTCDICQGGPTTTPPLCVDTLTTCGSFDIPKACLDFPKWALESCRFTCKVCTELEPPIVVPPGVGRK